MISIALAAYNGEKYIGEQIDSILVQTYQDFELIVCDDCSTDNTWQILEEYTKRDRRIKIYRNETNLGFKKNFEKAITLCKGDYVALSDQDDIWMENHLEVLLQNIGNKSIACGNSLLVDSEGNSKSIKLNEYEGLLCFDDAKYIYRSLLNGNCLQGANMLMPLGFANKCLPIPNGVPYHDAWFAACACLDNGISYLFEIINKYRQHGENITFISHNLRRSFFQKLRSRIGYLKYGFKTDRFYYVENLKKRYGLENKDFEFIYHVYEKVKHHRILGIKDVIKLWNNYHYIRTTKTHKGFLDFLITLHLKKPIIKES